MKKIVVFLIILAVLVAGVIVVRQKMGKRETTYSFLPGGHRESLVVDGRTRTYLLHIPSGYQTCKSHPLVIVLHGGKGSGQKIAEQTAFPDKADKEGFIAVFPDGIDNTWNNGLIHEKAPDRDKIDDVAFIRALVTNLASRYSIDEKRIYATGVSNGGMMANRLGCEMSDILAAIGPDIGPPVTTVAAACKPTHLVAVVGIQGDADPLVPLGGGELTGIAARYGENGEVLSAEATMQLWASNNRCNPTPTITHVPPAIDDGTSVDKYTFLDCDRGADLVYYIVNGMGHSWPPNPTKELITGHATGNINATEVF